MNHELCPGGKPLRFIWDDVFIPEKVGAAFKHFIFHTEQ